MLSFFIEAPALAGPGLNGWTQAKAILRHEAPYVVEPMREQIPAILPPIAQRRGSASTLLAVWVAQASLADSSCRPQELLTVFASSIGDPEISDQLCRSLAAEAPQVSPLRFHNSVHNAPAGYWSIATESLQPTSSLAACDASFSAGLMSAAVQTQAECMPVMLVAYDLPYPAPLDQARPIAAPFAVAMVLTPEKTHRSRLHCQLELSDTQSVETRLPMAELEALRTGNPAARALPLLMALANTGHSSPTLSYLPGLTLLLECTPC